jgi:hypothetical protein
MLNQSNNTGWECCNMATIFPVHETRIDIEKLAREEVVIKCILVHAKRLEARLWIAKQIIRFAVWLAGVNLKVDEVYD